MSTRIGSNHKLVKGPDGRTRLVIDAKAVEAKKSVVQRISDRKSKKVKVARPGNSP